MKYHLVLDATAVAVYAAGSISVGEVLAEAADEPGALVAVPFHTLVQACARGVSADAVRPLTTLGHVDVIRDCPWSWRILGVAGHLLGGVDRAWAALLAEAGEVAFVLTADPDAYGGIETIGI